MQSCSITKVDTADAEKSQMHQELRDLMDKYMEMAKRMGASSSIEQLLTSNYLPYSVEITVAPILPKLKVHQVEMYNGSKHP